MRTKKSKEIITYRKLVVKYIETLVLGGYCIEHAVFEQDKLNKAEMLAWINERSEDYIYSVKG